MRRGVVPLAVAALLTLSLLLGGCGQGGGDTLARQACQHVERSLTLYAQAEKSPSASVALSKVAQAYKELRAALPLAALATSNNGQWVALETTLTESSRVDEGYLVNALTRECAVAMNPNAVQLPTPSVNPKAP
jgi:hypothetical protein